MSAIHGRSTQIFINQFDVSNQLKTYNAQSAAPEIECTAFTDTARQYIANFREGSLSLEGFFQQNSITLAGIDDIFQDLKDDSSPAVVTLFLGGEFAGDVVSEPALLCQAVETRCNTETPADGYISAMADFRGAINRGVNLSLFAAITATGAGSEVDHGAATANGAVAHLHITARSGTSPTNTTKIQHSTNNSTWVDLVSFAAKTNVGAERVSVTGTVNRYVREFHTLGGTSPSFTQFVTFARLQAI